MAEIDTTRGNRKVLKGKVVSKSGDKSVIVKIVRRERHPLYGKFVNRFNNLHAHDEDNSAQVGDEVMIVETRPLSATKRWCVVKAEEK